MQHASNVTHLHKIAGRQQAISGREAKPKLLDQLREALQSRHYSHRIQQTCWHWAKRSVYFHDVHHPSEMGKQEINSVSIYLALKEKISHAFQNHALLALLFFIGMCSGVNLETRAKSFAPKSKHAYPLSRPARKSKLCWRALWAANGLCPT